MSKRNLGRGTLRTFLISLTLSVVAALSSYCRDHSSNVRLSGAFRVVDGDTLTLARQRLRLSGLDAPERGQRCGAAPAEWDCGLVATRALSARIDFATVCEGNRRDRYRRLLVRCRNGRGDIGADLVRQGIAVAYGDYGPEERAARDARRGLWSGPFQRPADWRKSRGDLADTQPWSDWIVDLWR